MNSLTQESLKKTGRILPQKPVVLVMGAGEGTLRMLKLGLEMYGHDVAEARGFEESLIVAKTRRPSLIVMDAILPFIENLTAMDRLQDSDGARVFPSSFSGFSHPDFQMAALDHGRKVFSVKLGGMGPAGKMHLRCASKRSTGQLL